MCQKDKIPVLLEKNKKLSANLKINDLINQWDILDIPSEFLALASCFISKEKCVFAASNGRRFILRPTKHVVFHPNPSRNPGYKAVQNGKINELKPHEHEDVKQKGNNINLQISTNNKNLQITHIFQKLEQKILFSEKMHIQISKHKFPTMLVLSFRS